MTSPLTANLAMSELRRPIVNANVAAAGYNAATATALKWTWNRVIKVPIGAGVMLLPAITGLEVSVVRADNANDNVLAIFANNGTDDTFNGDTTVIGVMGAVLLRCFVHGVWNVVASDGPVFLSPILAGAGAVAGAATHSPVGASTPAGGGALSPGAIQWQLGGATLAGGSGAHA